MKVWKKFRLFNVLFLVFAMVAAGCASPESNDLANDKLQVTATTGMIADLVRNVGGEHVEVHALMGPGVDPHLYKASQGDIAKMQKAQIVFYNGLHLEGKMTEIFEQIAQQKPAIPVTERFSEKDLHKSAAFDGNFDPHVWFDVKLWKLAMERVRDGLIEVAPEHKADFEKNAAEYAQELDSLDAYAREQLKQIPKEQRVLVTAHDAFYYFGAAYEVEVIGLQGISTDSEYGLKDVQNMVGMITDRKIKAVFVESSVPKKAIEAVVEGAKAKNHSVNIGGELFSDAMGDEGTAEGTYIGMVRHNVDTVVSALK